MDFRKLYSFWKIGRLVFYKQNCCENSVKRYSDFFLIIMVTVLFFLEIIFYL